MEWLVEIVKIVCTTLIILAVVSGIEKSIKK